MVANHRSQRALEELFDSLQALQGRYQSLAACYHEDASFQDIAFDLSEKRKIVAMWHMISESDLKVSSCRIDKVSESGASAKWVADYTFKETGRRVHNEIRSNFMFKDGLILKHEDDCNAFKWATQALGPVSGFMAWLVPPIRRKKAKEKLDRFIELHPEYQ